MNEKMAVNDILGCLTSGINKVTYAVQESNDETFRQSLIDARTKLDNLKWDTYLIAKEKGYYIPAAPAGDADIEQVKNIICK